MVEGGVKYKDSGTHTVEGTIMCAKPFIGRAFVHLGASVNIFPYNIYTNLYLPLM